MIRIARFCFERRRVVVAAWVLGLVIVSELAGTVGSSYVNNLRLPGKGSQQAADLLKQRFPAHAGSSDTVVIHARTGSVTDPAVRAQVTPMLAKLAGLPNVAAVVSPYSPQGARQISKDGTIAFAQVDYTKRGHDLPTTFGNTVVKVAKTGDSATVQIEATGPVVSEAQRKGPGATEAIGLLAAVIILLMAFGSIVAMGVPIITSLIGLGIGLSAVGMLSTVVDTADFAPQLGAMIGLGVGIDYTLFIVTRFRDAFHENGGDVKAAIELSMNTAGRAVLFAGATVVIALLGMLLLGVSFLYGVAVASSLVVAVVMAASITLAPALLGFWGRKVGNTRRDKRRVQQESDTGEPHVSSWVRWSSFISRRPWTISIAATLALLMLCVPMLSMRLGSSDAGNDPATSTTRKAYDLLATGFGPGFNGPLLIAAQTGSPTRLAALRTDLAGTPGVASVTKPQVNAAGDTAVLQVYPTTSPESKATTDLVHTLRSDVIPKAAAGTVVYVGGLTASFGDLAATFSAKLPLFIGIVVLLSALLLLMVFRSVVIPVQAALMNLLSIGASLGIVTAIFQNGFLSGPLGIEPGPIEAFLPVMLFAIVFGLSMDYEVFLISRIREEWVRTGDSRRAVGDGLAATGRVVTAAAAIMICVFASFVFGDERVIKEFGVGLAVAVFIDATIIRCLLLPAVLFILGDRTWALPAWLDRLLPHLAIEVPEGSVEPEQRSEGVSQPELEPARG